MNLVDNERLKLTASALNGVAIASIVAGVITPLAAASFGFAGSAARDILVTTTLSVAWLAAGGSLHLIARATLGGLRE